MATELPAKVRAAFEADGRIDNAMVRDLYGTTRSKAGDMLRRWLKARLIERRGAGPSTHYVVAGVVEGEEVEGGQPPPELPGAEADGPDATDGCDATARRGVVSLAVERFADGSACASPAPRGPVPSENEEEAEQDEWGLPLSRHQRPPEQPGDATWCPQHGPTVSIDDDGCCVTCGADSVGAAAVRAVDNDRLLFDVAAALGMDVPALRYLVPSRTAMDVAALRLDDGLNLRRCRVCGCSDARACAGGCSWVESDLCSACHIDLGQIERVARLARGAQLDLAGAYRHLVGLVAGLRMAGDTEMADAISGAAAGPDSILDDLDHVETALRKMLTELEGPSR